MERLQRAAESRARLLKTERLGSGTSGAAPGFLLSFEVGRLLIRSESASGDVHSVFLESRDGLLEELFDATEDEPWWRVMGSPLTRVWRDESPGPGSKGLRLQFRDDNDSPRIVALVPDGNNVRAFVDPKSRT